MREEKKRRLGAKGWKTGDAADFLQLSAAEARYVELRIALAEGLRNLRTRKALTQVDLAETVGSSQSRVAKMESADAAVSIDLLIRSLLALGASRKDLAKLISGGRA